jgi:restriction system protein
MPVPTGDPFLEPLLRFVAQHKYGVAARLAHEAAAEALG